MAVLVSDTSVLIDLERGGLLEAIFSLSFEIAVPDLLYERELKTIGEGHLIALGLRVEDLESTALSKAQTYRKEARLISLVDSFALALAAENGWTLLTGDGALREIAEKKSVACHGVLWLLDRMIEESAQPTESLFYGLTKISEHKRCRLPKDEVKARLDIYTKLAKKS